MAEKDPKDLTLTDEQIVTERKLPRRSFLAVTGTLLVGAAAVMSGVRAAAQDTDPDSNKATDPDKKKKTHMKAHHKGKKAKASDPDKKKEMKKASDPDSAKPPQ